MSVGSVSSSNAVRLWSAAMLDTGGASAEMIRIAHREFLKEPIEGTNFIKPNPDPPKVIALHRIPETRKGPLIEQAIDYWQRPMGTFSEPKIPPKQVTEFINKYKQMMQEAINSKK